MTLPREKCLNFLLHSAFTASSHGRSSSSYTPLLLLRAWRLCWWSNRLLPAVVNTQEQQPEIPEGQFPNRAGLVLDLKVHIKSIYVLNQDGTYSKTWSSFKMKLISYQKMCLGSLHTRCWRLCFGSVTFRHFTWVYFGSVGESYRTSLNLTFHRNDCILFSGCEEQLNPVLV